MWWQRFSNIISKALSPAEVQELIKLNPDKFYVENVRSLLGVSSSRAAQICETAVRQGVFKRGIEVLAPDGAVVYTTEHEAELPPTVHFWIDRDGQYEEGEADTQQAPKRTYYRLIDDDSRAAETHAKAS
jgi:hypothetical protein